MSDRFDFEQQIMKCWNVVDEIEEVYNMFYEQTPIDNDKLAHCLLGLHEMYQARFNALWEMFEDNCRTHYEQVNQIKDLTNEVKRLRCDVADKTPNISRSIDDCSMEEWDGASRAVRQQWSDKGL